MCIHKSYADVSAPAFVSPFEVGEKVKVVRKVEKQAGWELVWVTRMDAYVNDGNAYTISRISERGVYFVEDGEKYGFPSDALEAATEDTATETTGSPKVGDKVRMVMGYESFSRGDTGTIRQIDKGDYSEALYTVVRESDGDTLGMFAHRFEVITEASSLYTKTYGGGVKASGPVPLPDESPVETPVAPKPTFKVYDPNEEKPQPVVRFKLRQDGDEVDLIAVDADGRPITTILTITAAGEVVRMPYVAKRLGLQLDSEGRIKLN